MSPSPNEGHKHDSGDFDGCPEMVHQPELDLFPSTCTGHADWFNSTDLSEVILELQVLRDAEEPLTKEELAKKIYPKAFTSSETYYVGSYRKFNLSRIEQQYYKELVAKHIRALDSKVNEKLDELADAPLEQINYLRQQSLAIRVGEDAQRRVLLAYHGPDAPQPPEALEDYIVWAESHRDKNGRLQKLAGHLYQSAVNPSGNQLDNSDIPGITDLLSQDELGLGG